MTLKQRWRNFRKPALAKLAYYLVAGVGRTLRYDRGGEVPVGPQTGRIFCGWHGKSFVFAWDRRHQGDTVVISQSNDGDIQNEVFSRLGFRTLRGSTGRGGERALIGAIRALRAGGSMAMTPDGPRGPSGVVQMGVMAMAQKSGAELVPVGIAVRPAYRAGSWDRYVIPALFARVRILYGPGLPVPKEATPEEVEAIRLRLQAEIDRLEDQAASEMGLPKESIPLGQKGALP